MATSATTAPAAESRRTQAAQLAKEIVSRPKQSQNDSQATFASQGPAFALNETAQKKMLEERQRGNAWAVRTTASNETSLSAAASDTDYFTTPEPWREGARRMAEIPRRIL